MILRPYQHDAIKAIYTAYTTHNAPLLVAPTGSGKTTTFCEIVRLEQSLNKRVIILVHRRELVEQTSEALFDVGIAHGIIAPGYADTQHAVQVASVQTLVNRRNVPQPDLLIFDEGHHATAGSWQTIIERYPSARILGVTATPCRLSGRGLSTVYDVLIQGPQPSALIEQGYLSDVRVFAPELIKTAGLRIRAGDYKQEDVDALVNNKSVTGCAVEWYSKLLNGAPSFVFCASVAHSHSVADQFAASGFRAMAIDGSMDRATRADVIQQFRNGQLNLLASCDLISEGFNVPGAFGAILLRPTASTALYLQQVGRALRPYPGKSHAVIIDHVGNTLKHGHPAIDRSWSLSGGIERDAKQDSETVMIKQCPECFFVHAPADVCPSCGYRYPVKQRPGYRVVDGELVEITKEESEAMLAQCRTLSDFHAWAKSTGKSAGTAWIKYKLRCGRGHLEGAKI